MSKKLNPKFILSGVAGGTISAIIIGGALMLGIGLSENSISETVQNQKSQTKKPAISKKVTTNSHLLTPEIKNQNQKLQTKNARISKNMNTNSYLRTPNIKKDQISRWHNSVHKNKGAKQKVMQKKNFKNTKMLKNNNTQRSKLNRKTMPARKNMNQKMENLLASGAITTDEYNELSKIITPQSRETFITLLNEYLEDNESEANRRDSLKTKDHKTKGRFGDNRPRRGFSPR